MEPTTADAHDALAVRWAPFAPRAAVLVLNGGRADALEAPPRLNLPALRMRPVATGIVRATQHDHVLVGHVRYRHRGWNGGRADALQDAREALRALLRTAGDVPVVLVGHSMGGRAALRLAGDPHVNGVVALAPWCPPGDPVDQLRGRRVAALHDPADRVTSARETWDLLDRADRIGAHTLAVPMAAGGHAMLRDARAWHRTTTSLTLGLLGLAPLPAALAGRVQRGSAE
ncbi:alpha/beta fold hydrolase [Streptomyces sp. NPDC058701]|uniref:alpha/beta fold hydrolase n=1 Tax=Streptomyces sp. NPDC058701 TaxID=3346608 RepID=UPI003669532F